MGLKFLFDKYAPFGKYLIMSEKRDHPPAFICGLDAALRVVGGKWKPLILYFLAKETMRYGALKRAVSGVSDKVLIQQLKELEAHAIVTRTDYKEIPPRVEYSLTPLGCSLADAFRPLCVWGEDNTAAITKALRT